MPEDLELRITPETQDAAFQDLAEGIVPSEHPRGRFARLFGGLALLCILAVGLFRTPVLSVAFSFLGMGLAAAAGLHLARGLRRGADPGSAKAPIHGMSWVLVLLAAVTLPCLGVVSILTLAATRSGATEPPLPAVLFAFAGGQDRQALHKEAIACMTEGDYRGSEKAYRLLLKRQPTDAKLRANLAIALTYQDKHGEAIGIYETLIREGNGTYDLFAFLARSLAAVGRTEEAAQWDYRALSLVPTLVDVRGDLAKLLVKQGRAYEALSLLAGYDDYLERRGQPAYFKAQRLAVASTLPPAAAASAPAFRLPRLEAHYYGVALGTDGQTIPLLIDTGATHTTLSRRVLEALGTTIPANARKVTLETADGRKATGLMFVLPHLRVGPYDLKDVQVVGMESCVSLLGQSALERFDLTTTRMDGLEFLTLRPRS